MSDPTTVPPMPWALANIGYILGPEVIDSVFVALVELTNAGKYFDDGF